MNEEYLNKEQVARFLGVSERTIDEWRSKLGFPCFKAGFIVLFSKPMVIEWINERMTGRDKKAQTIESV